MINLANNSQLKCYQIAYLDAQYRRGLYQDNSTNTAYNINTNSLILVALWFKSRGNIPIYQPLDNRANKTANKPVNEKDDSDLTASTDHK
ncbi:hypothetical protein [Moritella marina]|uniref:hypothetical protein n=1 Tax=Moritella marina TaxID=90736 RepID=UPI0037043A4E